MLDIYSPLEQFEIVPYIYIYINTLGFNSEISLTNLSISLIMVYLISMYLLLAGIFDSKIIPGFWQYIIESIYLFVLNLVKQQVGTKGQIYFPLLFSVFFFILISNVSGMIPYGFTATSHIVQTFTLGFSIFIGITIIGVLRYKKEFLNLFIPKDVPAALLPLLITIETISYITKPFSLSIRLFANLMSGHTLLFILSGFAFTLFYKSIFIGIWPFIIILAIVVLEFGIAILQAYVFLILLSIYLNDSYSAGSH